MKTLSRQRKVNPFNLVKTVLTRTLLFGALAYHLVYLVNEPFLYQIGYILLISSVSVLIDYLASRSTRTEAISINDDKMTLLNVDIDLSSTHEILYCQTKRFEHSIRFRFSNDTYQDFELSDSDLIENLRFYHFLVDNQLPIKMLDNDEQLR